MRASRIHSTANRVYSGESAQPKICPCVSGMYSTRNRIIKIKLRRPNSVNTHLSVGIVHGTMQWVSPVSNTVCASVMGDLWIDQSLIVEV